MLVVISFELLVTFGDFRLCLWFDLRVFLMFW